MHIKELVLYDNTSDLVRRSPPVVHTAHVIISICHYTDRYVQYNRHSSAPLLVRSLYICTVQ
jgi:hypothetical protein